MNLFVPGMIAVILILSAGIFVYRKEKKKGVSCCLRTCRGSCALCHRMTHKENKIGRK